jgi:hypothetical protein
VAACVPGLRSCVLGPILHALRHPTWPPIPHYWAHDVRDIRKLPLLKCPYPDRTSPGDVPRLYQGAISREDLNRSFPPLAAPCVCTARPVSSPPAVFVGPATMGPDWPVFPCPRASLCVVEGSAALLAAYHPSSYRLRHRPRCATRGSSLRVRRWIPSSPRTLAAARSLEVSASTPWPRCPRTHHRPRFRCATGVAALPIGPLRVR